jgi:hypothetical protein
MNLNKHVIYDGIHPVTKESKNLMKGLNVDMPLLTRPDSFSKVYRFNNGYGASLVKGWFSMDMWELAVLQFEPVYKNRIPKSKRLRKKYHKKYPESWINYRTPIGDDVKRYHPKRLDELNNDLTEIKHFKAGQY